MNFETFTLSYLITFVRHIDDRNMNHIYIYEAKPLYNSTKTFCFN